MVERLTMPDFNSIYNHCPRGCKPKPGKYIAQTIKGWKRHMTATHGDYTQEELDAIVGVVSPDSSSGREQFLSEAEKPAQELPGTSETPATDAAAPQAARTVNVKTEQATKRMSGKLNAFKDKLSKKLPERINDSLKENAPEWAMNSGDLDFLTESIKDSFDVLDINFEVRPIGVTLSNPLWVLALPGLALLVIFLPIIMKNARKQLDGTDETPAPILDTMAVSSE